MIDKNDLTRLKAAMESLAVLKEEKIAAMEQFEQEHVSLFDAITKVTDDINTLKDGIMRQAIEEHSATGERKLAGGVGIRMMTDLIYDETIALQWAKDHEMALMLDAKLFGKLAKEGVVGDDIVKTEPRVQVTFPEEITIEERQ